MESNLVLASLDHVNFSSYARKRNFEVNDDIEIIYDLSEYEILLNLRRA